jgi:hypothetical protein
MDPFLELPAYWHDFHFTFINYWSEAVADTLPDDYEATIGERYYPAEHDPDIREVMNAKSAPSSGIDSGDVPKWSTILDSPRQTYIEILHQPERRLVAALELLSPANKENPGRIEYLAKRQALVYQDVHLIELDLLHTGRRLPLQEPLPEADYYYLLSRSDLRPDCEVYRWRLPDPLPTLPVPLRAPDPDIFINLATVFTTAYERGRFRRRLPYRGEPPAFLSEPSRRWVESVLNAPVP